MNDVEQSEPPAQAPLEYATRIGEERIPLSPAGVWSFAFSLINAACLLPIMFERVFEANLMDFSGAGALLCMSIPLSVLSLIVGAIAIIQSYRNTVFAKWGIRVTLLTWALVPTIGAIF